MNYIEREIEGLKPDVALVGAMPERREIYDYMGRLLRALEAPPLVLFRQIDQDDVRVLPRAVEHDVFPVRRDVERPQGALIAERVS